MTGTASGVVSVSDVCAAARVVLRLDQSGGYVAWREVRWYSDVDLKRLIARERDELLWLDPNAFFAPGRVHRDDTFSLQTALEIMIAGLPMAPRAVISSLYQLGVVATTSPEEHFEFAWTVLDRPELFDPIREMGLELDKVLAVDDAVGGEWIRLAWQAGLTGAEVVSAVETGVVPDVAALETMRALRMGQGDPLR